MGMKSYVLLLVAFIACQFARVQALASADGCESVPSDLIHLDHAAQHIQALSQGESIFVEGYMKSVESSHHFVLQNEDGSMEVTVLTPTSLLVPARLGERMRVTGSVWSNAIGTTLLLSEDEAAVVLCGTYSKRQLQHIWNFGHPTYPARSSCECDCGSK